MKNTIFLTVNAIIVFLYASLFSQSQTELTFRNMGTARKLKVQCLPVSAIYNGDKQLNLISKYIAPPSDNLTSSIVYYDVGTFTPNSGGPTQYYYEWQGATPQPGYNMDYKGGGTTTSIGNIGAGIYKVRVWATDIRNPQIDPYYTEFYYEIDARGILDSYFQFYDDRVIQNVSYGMGIIFHITALGPEKLLEDANGYIRSWDPYENPQLPEPLYYNAKDFGEEYFEFGVPNAEHPTPNPYLQFPLVCISDCSYDFGNGTVTQNQAETGETSSREGRIPLNTIFTKTITTRSNYPAYGTPNSDFPISIESGATLTIGSGSHHTGSGAISFNITPFSSDPGFGNVLNVKSPNPTSPMTALSLEDQNDGYERNANINIHERCKIVIENGAKLYCGKYSQIFVNSGGLTPAGTMDWNEGSNIEMKDYSQILINNNGVLTNKGATTFSNTVGAEIKVETGGKFELLANKSLTITNGGKLNINGGTLLLGSGATLIFDGQFTNFSVNNNSTITLGEGAKIIVRNGAYMNTSGSSNTFAGVNGVTWQGIEFDHSRNNNIHNCTFNNAKVALKFIYDPTDLITNSYIAYNNFNVPSITGFTTYGIYSEDMNFVGIGNNIFSLASSTSSVGIYMKTTTNGIANDPNQLYKILIYGNEFRGGNAALVLLSYAATLKPYVINGNIFNNNTSNVANYGIVGKLITGLVENNSLAAAKTNVDLALTQSSLNIAYNNFGALSNNIIANSYSNLKMAPTVTNNDLILDAGYNDLYSTNADNILLGRYQTILLNNGYNCFSHHGNGFEHLNGSLNTYETDYDAYNNFWNPYPPDYNLFNLNNEPITLHHSQTTACRTLSLTVDQVVDRGNGLFDTIYKAVKPSSIFVIPDEELYNQATSYLNALDYPTAILNYKSLINGYPESQYLPSALYDLYSAYQGLDTSINQANKDNLYSDLKTYLNDKINSNLYSGEFNDLAYNMVLMCETNMQDYNDALTGYQFIAMYHPDAITRLMASWDYAELEALFNGLGGSFVEPKSEEDFISKTSHKLEKVISKDSTMKFMKRCYEKESALSTSKLRVEIESKDISIRNKAIEKKVKDELIIKKTNNILMLSKSLTREQRSERQLEDILFISNNGKTFSNLNSESIVPQEYNLSQNYPNPFNPSTTIKYSIPMQCKVVLKIYDITGKEIKTLINDFKNAGYYSITFNSSELSSGVYFYKLVAGDFVQTKKMILIK